MDKSQLRHQIKNALFELTPEQRIAKSKKACANLINAPQFQQATVVMLYLPLPHEADDTGAILCAWQREKTVAVPKVSWQQRHMIAVEINSLETGIATEASGLRNPITGAPMPVEEIDLVVTPGLAFDANGNRLGRGGAYFDRFFGSPGFRAVKCGFAFSEQVVESVPVQEHDQLVDLLVTEEGVIYCNESLRR